MDDNAQDDKGRARSVSIGQVVEGLLLGGASDEPKMERRYIDSQILFVESVFPAIMNHLAEGRKVQVREFGTFSTRMARASMFDPNSKCAQEVEDRVRLGFVPSRKSVKILNRKDEE